MYELTVIIPTYNEEFTIGQIITAVDAVFAQHNIRGEILVVDDNSPDHTGERVTSLKKNMPNLNLLVRTEDHGLSQSVVDGFSHADSTIFLVMDADLSHPPALIPEMYRMIKEGSDIVVGSRYMKGGMITKWPVQRRVISLGATLLGRLLLPDITDPVSGFFAVKKGVVEHAQLKPRGYKILLEILGKGTWEQTTEIPFEFVDRATGTSKLTFRTVLEYACQVIDIAAYSLLHRTGGVWQEWKKFFKFGLVGLSGIVVNEGILIFLKEYAGFSIPVSGLLAIELSILNNFVWNDLWTFKSLKQPKLSRWYHRLLSFQVVSVGGAAINFGILNGLTLIMGTDYRISNIIGILIAFAWNFLINRRITWMRT